MFRRLFRIRKEPESKTKEQKKAHDLGYNTGESIAETVYGDPDTSGPDELYGNFQEMETQTADYTNNTLPFLRELAGCKDVTKAGTFTGCSDEAEFVYEELVQIYWEGVSEGVNDTWEELDRRAKAE